MSVMIAIEGVAQAVGLLVKCASTLAIAHDEGQARIAEARALTAQLRTRCEVASRMLHDSSQTTTQERDQLWTLREALVMQLTALPPEAQPEVLATLAAMPVPQRIDAGALKGQLWFAMGLLS